MRALPPMRAVIAFEATARLGSMALAAAELGITPSAVSHRVAGLEAYFGQALFRRIAGRMELSEGGQALADRLGGGLAEIAAACAAFSGASTLHIRVAASLAAKWLRPRLGGFLATHPGVALHVVDGLAEPQGGAEIALVYGGDAPATAETLLAETMVPLCSPALRARLPAGPGPADLRALPLLHSRNAVGWGEWFARFGLGPPPGGGLRFDRSHVAIDAACEGHGVVLESDLLTQAERRQGLLVPALEGAEAGLPSVGYALVLRPGPLSQPARLFLAWLRAEAAA